MTLKIELTDWQGSHRTPGNPSVVGGVPEVWLGLEGEHRARYRFARNYVKSKAVLDAGCGNGYGSVSLLKAGAKSVVGLDISEEAVNEAKSHYAAPNLHYQVGDLHKLPFATDSFDIVVAFEIIEQVPEFEQVLHEFQRVLKPGGLLLISTLNRAVISGHEGPSNPYLRREFSPRELETMLAGYFKLPFDIFGQFPAQDYSAKETFHIPTITESLTPMHDPQQDVRVPNNNSNNGFVQNVRHTYTNEQDYVFVRDRLEEAPVLVAVCRR